MTINRNARLSKLEAHLQRVRHPLRPSPSPMHLRASPERNSTRVAVWNCVSERAGASSPRLPKRGTAYAGALSIPDDVRAHIFGCIRHESQAGDFTYLPEVNVWFFDDILWRLPRSVTKLDI